MSRLVRRELASLGGDLQEGSFQLNSSLQVLHDSLPPYSSSRQDQWELGITCSQEGTQAADREGEIVIVGEEVAGTSLSAKLAPTQP